METHSTKTRKIILIVCSIILAASIFIYSKYQSYLKTSVDPLDTTKISFIIKHGQSVREIGDSLKEKGLIRSSMAFYIYVRTHGYEKDLISGRFFLNKSMTIPEVSITLIDPKKAEFIITIQEGLTIKDIEKKLIDLGAAKEGEFISAVKNFNGWQYYPFLSKENQLKLAIPLEGYIYPDTYFLDPSTFKPGKLIYLGLDNFEKKWTKILEGETTKGMLASNSMQEIITMASIVEKEVQKKSDREIVAGILWKRLLKNWTLGADATLLYEKENRTITEADINSDSKYNTRKNKGLPPGPIGNPGTDSILATIYPKETPYWFYLTNPENGETIYAQTNEEQNT
ncbi:endolytic transglycosylase MltG, partial [Candidatus Peregrinibacteria bacterium]|nr:endolytic transglycosylase MltG [Candidatus Peregrinibacteria bacterium]